MSDRFSSLPSGSFDSLLGRGRGDGMRDPRTSEKKAWDKKKGGSPSTSGMSGAKPPGPKPPSLGSKINADARALGAEANATAAAMTKAMVAGGTSKGKSKKKPKPVKQGRGGTSSFLPTQASGKAPALPSVGEGTSMPTGEGISKLIGGPRVN